MTLCIVVGKMDYPGAKVARYLGVSTSSVNRLAVSEEAADLKKYLKCFSTYVPSLTCFLVNCFGILLFPFVG